MATVEEQKRTVLNLMESTGRVPLAAVEQGLGSLTWSGVIDKLNEVISAYKVQEAAGEEASGTAKVAKDRLTDEAIRPLKTFMANTTSEELPKAATDLSNAEGRLDEVRGALRTRKEIIGEHIGAIAGLIAELTPEEVQRARTAAEEAVVDRHGAVQNLANYYGTL